MTAYQSCYAVTQRLTLTLAVVLVLVLTLTPKDELRAYRSELCRAHGLPCHESEGEGSPLWIGPFELAPEEQGLYSNS